MAYWQLTYGGVTQDASVWGVENLRRSRESARTDTVTFSLKGTRVDAAAPFAVWQPISITADGEPWFAGIVTKIPRKGSGTAESMDYEISGPWYWLENTVFQQIWTSYGAGGIGQVSTAQSSVILGQALNGLKLHSGQIIAEVLLYTQYACLGQAFPTVVTTAVPPGGPPSWWPPQIPTTFLLNLPPPPNPANGGTLPFQIGVISPSIVIPYTQQRDKSCADIIRLILKYTPDAVAWVDYATTPPTINIDRRGNLDGKAISVLNAGGGAKIVDEFNPTPRYDLQVPAVLVKFVETISYNSSQYSVCLVDQYPMGVPDNAPRNWISTVDLVGGYTTTQTSDVVTRARPVSSSDSIAMGWIFKREPWWKGNPMGNTSTYLYDWGNISCAFLGTTIDADDPLNSSNPNDVTLPGCPQLVNELLSAFPSWLQGSEELDSASVLIEVWLQYTGSDPATQKYFWYDPSNPTVPKTDGTGYYRNFYKAKVTNASTQAYTQLTSFQASEAAPIGMAQYLYECMAPLHWEGTIKIQENECSDPLPPGCVFNSTESTWSAMNALVLRVVEDIDAHTTTVTFGPPLYLGLQELVELFRMNEGLRPSYQLAQRTDGVTSSGSNVKDTKHASDSSNTGPPSVPGGGSNYVGPFSVTQGTNPDGSFWAQVNLNSTLYENASKGSNIPLTGLGVKIPILGTDSIWMLGQLDSTGTTVSGNPTMCSFGNGNDSAYSPNATPGTTGSIFEQTSANPPIQTLFRREICSFAPDTNGKPQLVLPQHTTTNLVMFTQNIGYYFAYYPFAL